MDDYTSSELLRWYERLERGILQFAEHVPLTPEHEQLDAPILVSCLMDACGLLDSVFRDMTSDPADVSGNKIPRGDCTIKEFAQLHAPSLELPKTRSVMLVSPSRHRNPFKPWESILSGGPYTDLDWWKAYNKVKHDRLANIKKCTLGISLDALCALH